MKIQLLRDEAVTQVVGGVIGVLLTFAVGADPGDQAPDHILVSGTLGNPNDGGAAVILVDQGIGA